MSTLREHIQKNPILYRLIAGSIGMTAITVILLTFLFSHSAERHMRDEIFRSQQVNLQRVASIVDFRAEYANYLMLSASRDKNISQLFYSMEGKDSIASLRALSEMRQSVKQLHSIYVYNEYSDQIFKTTSLASYSVRDKSQFDDQSFIHILDNISQYPKFSPILRWVTEEKPNGQQVGEYVYTYLLYDSYSGGAIKNILAFNFHQGWMGDALGYISSEVGQESSVWVVDQDRRIVYSDNGTLIGSEASRDRFPDDIFTHKSGYLFTGSGKNREMLVYAAPSRSGYDQWTFVSVSNYADLTAPFVRLRGIVYLIALAVSMVSLGGSFFFSRSIYRPVKEVMDDAERLRQEQARQQEMERNEYMRRLLTGNVTGEPSKIQENLNALGLPYNTERDNRLLMISVDYLSSYQLRFRRQMEETEAALERVIRDSLEENYRQFFLLKMHNGLWCACIPAEQSIRILRLQRIFDQINRRLMEQMEVSVSIAVSSMGHAAGDLPYLYTEVANILSFRFLMGQSRILTPEETAQYGTEKFRYPQEIEEKLISAMFAGKAQEAQGYYEQFVDQIRFFSVDDIRLVFILLANAVKRASGSGVAEASSVLLSFDQFRHKLQEMETLEDVNQLFTHLIWEVTEKAQDHTQKKYEQLIQQMRDYVAENYSSMSLSMNDVADHVDMSAAYLGRLFKQLTGITFTEYLTKYRLDTACDLLLHTNKTVNEISDAVGFTNSSYFYIVFKKNLGCTPNQYRKQNE